MRKYLITISHLQAFKLPKKDLYVNIQFDNHSYLCVTVRFNKSDTYLIIYWPNTKPVRTDIVFKSKSNLSDSYKTKLTFSIASDPKWVNFQHSLEYVLEDELRDAESIQRFLKQQLLRIECYAKHSLRKDSIIGTATVNLLLCLGGPTDHIITLNSVCIS